ncbi:unnamed protein product [Pedinophyceae sp. YPF-701]|nr:unnamed protein product [Pedinophyceae sp. YPF-701]
MSREQELAYLQANYPQLSVQFIMEYNRINRSSWRLRGTALHAAAEDGMLPVAKVLMQHVGFHAAMMLPGGTTPVHLAARRGHVAVLQEMLQNAPETVNREDDLGLTPLCYAVEFDRGAAVETLLAHGASLNVLCGPLDISPLHMAVANGHADMAQLLVSRGADPGSFDHRMLSPLHYAVLKGDLRMVHFLLDDLRPPASVGLRLEIPQWGCRGPTPLHLAFGTGSLPIIRALVRRHADPGATTSQGDTAVHWAILEGHVELFQDAFVRDKVLTHPVVRAALQAGPDGCGEGTRPLVHAAIASGLPSVVRFAVDDLGLDLGVRNALDGRKHSLHVAAQSTLEVFDLVLERLSSKATQPADARAWLSGVVDAVGGNVLHAAVQSLHPDAAEIVRKLVDTVSLDVMARRRDGSTPMHLAAISSPATFCKVGPALVARGADLAAKDQSGNTPLHNVAILNLTENARRLLSLGSPLETPNNYGRTPVDLAAQWTRLVSNQSDWIHALHGVLMQAQPAPSKQAQNNAGGVGVPEDADDVAMEPQNNAEEGASAQSQTSSESSDREDAEGDPARGAGHATSRDPQGAARGAAKSAGQTRRRGLQGSRVLQSAGGSNEDNGETVRRARSAPRARGAAARRARAARRGDGARGDARDGDRAQGRRQRPPERQRRRAGAAGQEAARVGTPRGAPAQGATARDPGPCAGRAADRVSGRGRGHERAARERFDGGRRQRPGQHDGADGRVVGGARRRQPRGGRPRDDVARDAPGVRAGRRGAPAHAGGRQRRRADPDGRRRQGRRSCGPRQRRRRAGRRGRQGGGARTTLRRPRTRRRAPRRRRRPWRARSLPRPAPARSRAGSRC